MGDPHYLGMINENDQIYFFNIMFLSFQSESPLFTGHETFQIAIMNFMIQSLNGWNNITWQAML